MPRRRAASSEADRAFSPSPSPVEEYDADPDQQWAVAGIVGESVDAFGVTRFVIFPSIRCARGGLYDVHCLD